ncbi:MAG: tetratricopeptide repeat protein [Treponema sp.]|nr:tetratricopeptide repeat protein [Treponema sp.]
MYLRNLISRQKKDPEEAAEEKWVADFSKEKNIRFDIKSEAAFDVSIRKNLFDNRHSLVLALKKPGCIAWVESPEHSYYDLVVSGSLRIDAKGGYGAGGISFRMLDEKTFYSFLISSKGYFRLDAVRNGMPFPLIGWTELPLSLGAALSPDQSVDFSIIAYGSQIIILIRGRWAAEINDSSILEGTVCFSAASYESGDPSYMVIRKDPNEENLFYSAEVFLEAFSTDSRMNEVSALFEKWRDSLDVDPKDRLNLAETFNAMGQYNAAMVQIRKCWNQPEYKKTQEELLLAGKLAQALGIMNDAETYISQCYEMDLATSEGKQALTEMAKILNTRERYDELKNYCAEAIKINAEEPLLWTFLGHAHWNLGEYKKAAAAYDRAFELDGKNGLLAKNAANVYDVMDRKKEALSRYLDAGRAFLKEGNYNDLGLLVPKLLSLGKEHWEARSLAGKWAFAVEDWKMADEEFTLAEELRKAKRPKPKKDGAQVFLEALLLIRFGYRQKAIPLLEEAVALEPEYALFNFRLAENLFLLDDDPGEKRMLKAMEAALALSEKEEDPGQSGWVNNFAAQVALRKGDLNAAAKYLEKAGRILGDLPAVRVNRGVLFYLSGSMDDALALLEGDKKTDPDGIMNNCAANLLLRAGRLDEASEKYRLALNIAPENVEYLCNRASCLIEMSLFGEADSLLGRAHDIAPSAYILEMISYVAAKKGEYDRAEQACRAALELDPGYAPSLLNLGWILMSRGKHEEVHELIQRLEKLDLKGDSARGRQELSTRLDETFFQSIECAYCERLWKVRRNCPPAPVLRLFAMPPDELPAGSCTICGKTFCIGCAKENTDKAGRFICSACQSPLKLSNEGLKKLIYDWAVNSGIVKENKRKPRKPRSSKKK